MAQEIEKINIPEIVEKQGSISDMVDESKTFEEKIARVEHKAISITGLVFTILTIIELVIAKIFIIYKIIQILNH